MKPNLFIFLILLCIGAKNYAQNVNIPDAIFKTYLVNQSIINTNGDSEIQVSEAGAFTGGINITNLGIYDLTGIEAFTQLGSLNCSLNNLNQFDISNNVSLTNLNCGNNQLSQLDVSNNVALTFLSCGQNNLSQLDMFNNINLHVLWCSSNNLSQLNVSNNINLIQLYCDNNNLNQLDISNNVALVYLYCDNN